MTSWGTFVRHMRAMSGKWGVGGKGSVADGTVIEARVSPESGGRVRRGFSDTWTGALKGLVRKTTRQFDERRSQIFS